MRKGDRGCEDADRGIGGERFPPVDHFRPPPDPASSCISCPTINNRLLADVAAISGAAPSNVL
jgi:hypothetical protein